MTKTNKRIVSSKKKKSKAMKPRKSPGKGGAGATRMAAMIAYDQMVRDPCGAAPAKAPYTGTESGYTARTVDQWKPFASIAGTAGQTGVIDCAIAVIPRTYLANGNGPMLGGANVGSTITMGAQGPPENFVKGFAKRWRALAVCLKWVPNGPYSARSGTVGLGYSSSTAFGYGQGNTAQALAPLTLERSPNGSQAHEVRWLPAAIDENFVGAVVDGTDESGAQVFAVLQGVDATWANGSTVYANGYFEVTTIWEWLPPTGGVSTTPVCPPPFSINDHQSTIGNISSFLLKGVRTLANNSYVQAAGSRLLTAGYAAVTRSLPAIGMLAL